MNEFFWKLLGGFGAGILVVLLILLVGSFFRITGDDEPMDPATGLKRPPPRD